MTQSAPPPPPRPSAPFLGRAFVLVAALGLLASWPAFALAGTAGVVAVQLAAAVVFAGAALGRTLGALVPAGSPDTPVQRAMAALGGRLLGTAVLCLLVAQVAAVPLGAFAAAVVPMYLVLLVLEVRHAVQAVRPGAPDGALS